MADSSVSIDVLIFGGGIAGLWLLDDLRRAGYSALLLENNSLGYGQTIACQGIIHGGLKYMFDGNLNPSARIISDMPPIWRACLTGQQQPDLSATALLSDCQYIWGTASIKSKIFMAGSSLALRTRPISVDKQDWPTALKDVPGKVLRVDEQVIDPPSLMRSFAQRNQGHILHIDPTKPPLFTRSNDRITSVRIYPEPGTRNPEPDPVILHPQTIVFTAGQGNATLREQAGLSNNIMQRRPLHMVMVRGQLPRLFGHCVGGPRPRITVTTAERGTSHLSVWLIGGQIAEDGVQMDPPQLAAHAKRELLACIPNLDLSTAQFATYRVDRAEAITPTGHKPDDVHILQDSNLLTAFPTKLALAPRLAQRILELLPPPSFIVHHSSFIDFPTPPVAQAPWEAAQWLTVP